jgi:hypothetical protein
MPDNGPEKKNDWLATKFRGSTAVSEYDNHDRAMRAHAQWCVGYEEDEIAAFFGVSEIEVKRDLQYVHENMTARQVISMNNDRDRIRLQRQDSKEYRRILNEALTMNAKDYIIAGMSPVPPMREYREAVSMTEKPGGLAISFTKNTANIGMPQGIHPANIAGRNGIRSYEDLVRMVIQEDPSCGLQPVEVEAVEAVVPNLDDIVGDVDTETESLEDVE